MDNKPYLEYPLLLTLFGQNHVLPWNLKGSYIAPNYYKNLLSQSAVKIEVENTDTIEDLIEAIIKANNNLQTSSNNNDWEMIGKDMKKLQELIVKLEELKEEEDKKKQETNNNQNTITIETQNNV